MQTQRINITLPVSLIKDLNAIIPAGKRSEFIAKIVSEKLLSKKNLHKELEKSLMENREFYKKEYDEWKTIEAEVWPD